MRCGPRARCIFSVSLWAWLLYFVSSLVRCPKCARARPHLTRVQGYFLVDGLAASYTPLTDYQVRTECFETNAAADWVGSGTRCTPRWLWRRW